MLFHMSCDRIVGVIEGGRMRKYPNDAGPSPLRAALYVRMSTELQKYSTENQKEAISTYALTRGLEVVQSYADEGKSGLTIRGRGRVPGGGVAPWR